MKNTHCTICVLALLAFAATAVQARAQSDYGTPYAFTNFAGIPGVLGTDDGAGAAARFYYPEGVAVDRLGNVYVSDSDNYTVRKITPSGEVTTLAGVPGQSGTTDGVGNIARFAGPYGLTADNIGNVYVADPNNNSVRKITATGAVTTLAGGFASPYGVAVDSDGFVYVVDTGNHTIRKVTPAGAVTTLAGSAGASGSVDGIGSVARFAFPLGLAVDTAGNVFVADPGNFTIRKIAPQGIVSTIAGSAGVGGNQDGIGSAAQFALPIGVAVDSAGQVYVTDAPNHRITKGILAVLDSDGDGVPDAADKCPYTPAGAVVNEHGCSIEQLVPCTRPATGGSWKNHGQYVLAVVRAAKAFHSAGLVTTSEKRAIVRDAIRSDCGRRHHPAR